MSKTRRFRPVVAEPLEERLVLDAAGLAVAPVNVAALDTSGRRGNLAKAVSDQVNVAFDSFSRDYLQAQGAYTSPNPNPNPSDPQGVAARTYFRDYVVQRLSLLSQQLTRVFTQLPGGLNRIPGSTFGGGSTLVLTSFLRTRITGNDAESLSTALARPTRGAAELPLGAALQGTAATLYTSQALTAIDSTRTATLNATNFLLHHTFKNGHR
jgi:hypothetical protein